MNMYAIIIGALFIAFYSICGEENLSNKDALLVMVAILGFVASLCWLGAVKGHYEWMKSFVMIVKYNERRYFGHDNPNAPFVYSKVMACEDTDSNKSYLYGFFSTQKITLFLISLVALAWAICLWITTKCCCLFVILLLVELYCLILGGKYMFSSFYSTIFPKEKKIIKI